MKTNDFSSAVTSTKLKENMSKMFGINVNLDKYGREELEDMRNKLRTRVFQQEGAAGINDLLTNETYQKDKVMLDLLNTRIKEMLGENIAKLRDKMDELTEAKKGVRDIKHVKKAKGTKPDFLDMDKDGDKKEPMKKAVADKKAGPKKGVNPFAKKDKSVEEGFPTVAKSDDDGKKKTTGKFDVKKTSTGTQYTRKSNTFTDGGVDSDVKAARRDGKLKESTRLNEWDTDPEIGNEKNEGWLDDVINAARELGIEIRQPLSPDDLDHYSWVISDHIKEKEGQGPHPDQVSYVLTKFRISESKMSRRLKESNTRFKHNVRFVNESLAYLLNEDEEGKAKAITAASDMVNDFTTWMQRVGQYQTKAMIELADQIRADFGQQEAETFKQSVSPALSAALETLTTQREAISNAVAVLAGEADAMNPMGMEPGMDADMEPGMDIASPDEMNLPGDEFGASDAAAGVGSTGRDLRESNQERFARKLAESHSIMSKLAK